MMPTIESQLARYGQHLADLDNAGRLVAPAPETPRHRRSLVLAGALLVFVAALVGVAWRATESSTPSVDQPPTGTVPVEVVTLPDDGGTACTNDGLCVKLSPRNAAASPDTVWFVGITADVPGTGPPSGRPARRSGGSVSADPPTTSSMERPGSSHPTPPLWLFRVRGSDSSQCPQVATRSRSSLSQAPRAKSLPTPCSRIAPRWTPPRSPVSMSSNAKSRGADFVTSDRVPYRRDRATGGVVEPVIITGVVQAARRLQRQGDGGACVGRGLDGGTPRPRRRVGCISEAARVARPTARPGSPRSSGASCLPSGCRSSCSAS